jgi:PAS domain S-box-containing protein
MNKVLNVLCLEDSPHDAEIMRESLIDAGYNLDMDCTAVETEFVSFLRSHKYDLILSDFKLPGFDGFKALEWSLKICPDVPFICISGTIGEETAVELLKKGAVDYILKDRLIRLPSAIQRAIEQHNIQIEKKAAELLLKENEEKLQSIFRAAPVGIGLIVGKIFIEVNDTFCTMTGYNRSELIGKNAETIYAKDEQNESAGIVIFRHIAEKGTGSVETRFKCKDGRILNIFLSSTPLDKDDLSKGITFIAMDITERKRFEEALRESEEKFRILYNDAVVGLYRTNLNGEIFLANEALVNMLGFQSFEELAARNLKETGYGPSYQRQKFIDQIEKQGEVKDLEAIWICKDGTEIFVRESAKTIYGPDGKILYYDGTVEDVTDRKKAEKALMESEEKFRSIMENSADAIFITDKQGKYIYTNKAVSSMLGFSSEEMKCKTILDMTPQNRKDEYLEIFSQLQNKGKLFIEIELLKKNGKFISTDFNAIILPDGLVYGSSRDITERKHAKEELIKAKEKAEEGDRLKTAFLHNISHEIRTPMNAIVGFSALLGEPDVDTQSRKEYIEVIIQSSNHLLAIISDIVDISNIEANLVKIVKNVININSVLKSLCDQFLPKASEKKIQLICETNVTDSDASIIADSTKITQILINLINNAIKFTDKGYVKVGCVLSDQFLQFQVSDTGIGISIEYHQKIFDRFYQVQQAVSRLYEGTGLGLAISKANVELMGGKIWLTSDPGKGTSFYFTIPYEKQDVEILATNEKNVVEGFVFPVNKTILVAEDVDSNFKLINYFLHGTNAEAIRAHNGKEAIKKCLSNKNIDLILMDIKMPVMDGYTAVKLIRETNTTIPIIAQTAYIDDREQAIEFGCSGFISKPFDKKGLLKVLHEFI